MSFGRASQPAGSQTLPKLSTHKITRDLPLAKCYLHWLAARGRVEPNELERELPHDHACKAEVLAANDDRPTDLPLTMRINLPVAQTLKRFSVQAIDGRHIPAPMIADDEHDARPALKELSTRMPQRHLMLCDGLQVIAERQQQTRYGRH
ncbi:hypothetical protein CIT26_14060 [Mesorhizobium temperatum]|uniref:Uncharacterized protein n=1 Tax=Mesorhizobium temperatum TaxID=241416 RepID=A0A271LP78_9HYPH|nr:hypothetical protein CIT26_14060 [Mesorhizobium temperatum]